jgi:hypothetical protein
MTRVRDLLRRLRCQDGQTLTEFAIIAPVIVGLLIFALFFYEVVQIKLKQQEAERYVAWEFTGKKLTDYGNNGDQSSLFNQAKSDIVADAMERFDNLVSINKEQNQRAYVMTEWELRQPTIHHKSVPDVPGGFWANLAFSVFKIIYTIWDMQTYVDMAKNWMHGTLMAGSDTQPTFMGSGAIAEQFGNSAWKFNNQGFVQVKFAWRVAPTAMFTRRFMDHRFDKAFRPFGTKTLNDPASPDGIALVVDAWNLQDGQSITGRPGDDENKPYYKQVDRMAFVTSPSRSLANGYASVIKVLATTISYACLQFGAPSIDPMRTALAAKQYGPSSDGKRSLEGMTQEKPNDNFDTAPSIGAYKTAYDQRGEYFMGCKQQGVLGCNRSLSTDNPFGEFIVTGQ